LNEFEICKWKLSRLYNERSFTPFRMTRVGRVDKGYSTFLENSGKGLLHLGIIKNSGG
jgi:hypothetical protein